MKGKQDAYVITDSEGVDRIISEPNTGFYTTQFISAQDDRLVALHMDDSLVVYAGIALAKDSEFQEMFDYHIAKLIESGFTHGIKTKWIKQAGLEIGVPNAIRNYYRFGDKY